MQVKVGYAAVDIVPMSRDEACEREAMGMFIGGRHIIRIRVDLPASEQAATLWHELMHAVRFVYNLSREDLDEEMVCTQFAGPLCALFHDNPWLPGVFHQATHHGQAIVTLH